MTPVTVMAEKPSARTALLNFGAVEAISLYALKNQGPLDQNPINAGWGTSSIALVLNVSGRSLDVCLSSSNSDFASVMEGGDTN